MPVIIGAKYNADKEAEVLRPVLGLMSDLRLARTPSKIGTSQAVRLNQFQRPRVVEVQWAFPQRLVSRDGLFDMVNIVLCKRFVLFAAKLGWQPRSEASPRIPASSA
jgi:hypothetical protein